MIVNVLQSYENSNLELVNCTIQNPIEVNGTRITIGSFKSQLGAEATVYLMCLRLLAFNVLEAIIWRKKKGEQNHVRFWSFSINYYVILHSLDDAHIR